MRAPIIFSAPAFFFIFGELTAKLSLLLINIFTIKLKTKIITKDAKINFLLINLKIF